MRAGAFDPLGNVGADAVSFGDFDAVIYELDLPLTVSCQPTARLGEIVRYSTIEATLVFSSH